MGRHAEDYGQPVPACGTMTDQRLTWRRMAPDAWPRHSNRNARCDEQGGFLMRGVRRYMQRLPCRERTVIVLFIAAVTCEAAGQGIATTQPRRTGRRPRLMPVETLVNQAEAIFLDARARGADRRLRGIARIAAATRATEAISALRGQRVWLEAAPRALIERGRVRFSPPESARSATATRPADVEIDLVDVITVPESGHLIVVQMTPARAARSAVGRRQYLTGRVVRLRRIGPGRWEVWLRHSRVPRQIDAWPQVFPDYRERRHEAEGIVEQIAPRRTND